jgi:hypothetical protein
VSGLLEATKTTRAEFMAAFEVDKWRRDSEAAIANVKRLVEQHAMMCNNLQVIISNIIIIIRIIIIVRIIRIRMIRIIRIINMLMPAQLIVLRIEESY